ncbi:hypothetical protein L7F22_030634 [Adiantum nelumboides]|nr:hypothetical protein [Adiantum nelumboides]
MEENEGRAALLHDEQRAHGSDSVCMDWLGHPAHSRQGLGGWKCGLCILVAAGLVYATFLTVLSNLVIYLVSVLDYSNDAAAKTVTNLSGTAFLSSFIGALVSDSYLGRLWATMAFALLSLLGFTLSSVAVQLIAGGVPETPFFLASLYLMVIAIGSTFPNMASLGADQLDSSGDKAKYFTLVPITISVSQVFAVTLMSYLSDVGLWVWGFWLCTGASGLALALVMAVARTCRQCRASGNPLCRIAQVLVASSRNWNRVVPNDSSLLYEVDGEVSAIPGCRKLPHTSFLSSLDKAAVLISAEQKDPISTWRMCTVTQVEEVKCLVRILPLGMVSTCTAVAGAQLSTLFVEQASAMNTQVTSWLAIPPASLQLFSVVGAVITGLILNFGGSNLLSWCLGCGQRNDLSQRATPLQIQGMSIVMGIIAMASAAVVEARRLALAWNGDLVLSVLWLIPQTMFVGACSMLFGTATAQFYYNEVSDGMRALGAAVILLFIAGGNYLSTAMVSLATYLSSLGGHSSWIAGDLDEGHLDYFYWCLAAFLTFILGLYLIYAHFYTYREVQSS